MWRFSRLVLEFKNDSRPEHTRKLLPSNVLQTTPEAFNVKPALPLSQHSASQRTQTRTNLPLSPLAERDLNRRLANSNSSSSNPPGAHVGRLTQDALLQQIFDSRLDIIPTQRLQVDTAQSQKLRARFGVPT